jgi:hypothetical protein
MRLNHIMESSSRLVSRSKIEVLKNIPLSNVLGYSGLFLTAFCCLHWALSRCFHSVILPKIHNNYSVLQPPRDRIAVNFHYVACTIKFIVFVCIVYPFTQVIFEGANFDDSIVPGGRVSHGDILLLMGNLFCSLFIFELLYRSEFISWISAAHHIGTVIVGQLGIALSAYHTRHHESSIELYMCTVWGTLRAGFLQMKRIH